ncbi:MAG TPA: tetratricopeptide repeat protein [Chitinophagaceae bacterium]|nr:tetratricopeptide repeat protein [Chitinophagaceae bacterium]
MRLSRYIIFASVFFILCQIVIPSYGQLGISFDIKKPRQYEDRVLRSEKSDQKKFTAPRRFIQNTFTHYNYFFNANNRLNDIIERAKLAQQDDYSRLLSFYNYSLDVTAQEQVELDSLMYKAKTGIVLHDLRNDWVDNMYLLWGAAYYLRKDFDSAYLMFQFINYAFAPKEKDGYYRYIGSKMDGNAANSIATKESDALTKKLFSEPPSRNDAFIWQIRTLLAQEKFSDAASLIEELKHDPNFPSRLQNDLAEVQALYFFKQNRWDSAAEYLVNALGNAGSKQERTRWEYLCAQLYEKAGNYDEAEAWYTRVISHTTDAVMEIYARLNSIKVNKQGADNYIDRNVAELLKMAHKDRYADYRDIIYFMAAQMELERHNTDAAAILLEKSTNYNNGNTAQRNKAFLQLATLALAKKQYRLAYNCYDSLQMNDPELPDPQKITSQKEVLGKIAFHLETIDRQDSLQHLAALPEIDRKDFVKKLVKKLRKAQGLKDEDLIAQQGLSSDFGQQQPPDLFGNNAAKGEWYFYNATLRNRGAATFKSVWGNRPNVDNWRRAAAINTSATLPQPGNQYGGNQQNQPPALTFDALYDHIPLTTEKLQQSDDSIQNALYALVKLYADEMDDCPSVISTGETLQKRFPGFDHMEEVLFHLYRCYTNSGDAIKASQVKKQLADHYPSGQYATVLLTGQPAATAKTNELATKTYEAIYDQFIEGNFAEALREKKSADSVYGTTYWTPQLLYIEAVYHVKQREDSIAKDILQQISNRYPGSALAAKADNLVSVLNRRAAIEEELRNLKIEKPTAEPASKPADMVVVTPPSAQADTVTRKPIVQPKVETTVPVAVVKQPADTLAKKVAIPPDVRFTYKPGEKHYVMVILNKVDNVFRNEAKNAFFRYNRETFYNKAFDYSTIDIDAENKLLLIGAFDSAAAAIQYIQQAKPVATTQIIPWLKPEKYSFSIISDSNLELLKSRPNLGDYLKFIEQFRQGKF